MIVTLHYFERVALQDIAKALGVTESRVSQLHTRALRMLRAATRSGKRQRSVGSTYASEACPIDARDARTPRCRQRRPVGGTDGSYEVLLTRRPETMAFMGGTYVFPGGALDDADAPTTWRERSASGPRRGR